MIYDNNLMDFSGKYTHVSIPQSSCSACAATRQPSLDDVLALNLFANNRFFREGNDFAYIIVNNIV